MGWPKKDDEIRIYKDKDGSYFMIWVNEIGPSGYDAVANVLINPSKPSLGSTSVSRLYLAANWPKRVQWNELPSDWKKAFRSWFNGRPRNVRGFWRVENYNPLPPRRKRAVRLG